MTNLRLQRELQACPLHVLLLATQRALSRSGYGDVQFLGRFRRRQKSRLGGHDIVCETVMGASVHHVVVKVLRDTVRVRHLDELAGTVQRTRADTGLVVSPYGMTKAAAQTIGGGGVPRFHVVAGADMAEWFANYGVGVKKDGTVDRLFFRHLEEAAGKMDAFLKKHSK